MSEVINPPDYYFTGINFNPAFYADDSGGGLSVATANTLYLRKTVADTATAQETFTQPIFVSQVKGLTTASTMYVGNNITTGSVILGNTGIRTKIDGTLETVAIRTPATGSSLIIGDTLTTGNVDIGSIFSQTFLRGTVYSDAIETLTTTGNQSFFTTKTSGNLNVFPSSGSTAVLNIKGSGIKFDTLSTDNPTGTQGLYTNKTAGTLSIATTQTAGNINIGGIGSTININGNLSSTSGTSQMVGIYRFGGTSGGVYVSGSEPDLENGKHMTMMTGASTKIIWYYNWSMWAENGGSMYFYYGGSPESATSGTATARISTAGAFITISDISKKQDIKELTYGLDTIQQLRPVSFSYKTNPNDTELGFIAQEVEIVVPEIVDIDGKEGDEAIKGLKYIGFVPILVKAVQEMKLDYEAKIKELKEDYDTKLSKLEARLLALESKQVPLHVEVNEPLMDGTVIV